MKIKILKIFRENKTIEDLESKLKIVTQEKYDDSTIDSISERKIDLGAEFNIRGFKLKIATPTYIFLEENTLGTKIICKSNVIRPFLLSLFVAAVVPMNFVRNKDWLMYLFLSIAIFIFFFGVLMIRTRFSAKDFLRELDI